MTDFKKGDLVEYRVPSGRWLNSVAKRIDAGELGICVDISSNLYFTRVHFFKANIAVDMMESEIQKVNNV